MCVSVLGVNKSSNILLKFGLFTKLVYSKFYLDAFSATKFYYIQGSYIICLQFYKLETISITNLRNQVEKGTTSHS